MPQVQRVLAQRRDSPERPPLIRVSGEYFQRRDLEAVEYIRRMKGGAQAMLIRCSDDAKYVVKFQNNPQGKRILVNEMLGTLLAKKLGLPTAKPVVVQVSDAFIQRTRDVHIQVGRGRQTISSGPCFGSRYMTLARPRSPTVSAVESADEYLLRGYPTLIANMTDVAGFLVFDKWTCNKDGRQTVVVKDYKSKFDKVIMIDQGFCFNGSDWSFPDEIWNSTQLYFRAFREIPSFSHFEIWLDRLEHLINGHVLETISESIPREWYDADHDSFRMLLDCLDRRRAHVADLVWTAWKLARKNFPTHEAWLRKPKPSDRP